MLVRARQRPVRDHRRRDRHRRHEEPVRTTLNAPWSACGRTLDGFAKPELAAPGRYMVGPVPGSSTLAVRAADKVVAPGYIQLSGTSFAAPVVSGAAAQILARHPELHAGPGQGRADGVDQADAQRAGSGSVGVGELQMNRRRCSRPPAEPEQGARAVGEERTRSPATRPSTRQLATTSAKANVSWDSVSWDSVSWADAVLERRLLGGCLLERRLLGGRLLGGRLLGGCVLERHLLRGCGRGRHERRPERVRADSGAGGRDHGRPGDRSRPRTRSRRRSQAALADTKSTSSSTDGTVRGPGAG